MQSTTVPASSAVGTAFIIAASAMAWASLGGIVMQAMRALSIG